MKHDITLSPKYESFIKFGPFRLRVVKLRGSDEEFYHLGFVHYGVGFDKAVFVKTSSIDKSDFSTFMDATEFCVERLRFNRSFKFVRWEEFK